jgi:acetylornithine/succinyldiaminopimelate/putrescine aminotransferase
MGEENPTSTRANIARGLAQDAASSPGYNHMAATDGFSGRTVLAIHKPGKPYQRKPFASPSAFAQQVPAMSICLF